FGKRRCEFSHVLAFVKYEKFTFVFPFNVRLTALIPGFSSAINYDFTRRVDKKYFVSHKRPGSFDDAVQFCTKRGLVLALPKNREENIALTQVFEGALKNAWLNVDNRKEGKFQVDLKGHPLTFSKWGDGEPKVPDGDRGCTMLTESGAWQVTYDCSFNAYIVCEI
uniref:C-type lectin domain-containing protein n=1 Tax=Oncorhynchus tshawytscha TaxID=74940 RepID=A0AAZ3Q8E2_ONCTS